MDRYEQTHACRQTDKSTRTDDQPPSTVEEPTKPQAHSAGEPGMGGFGWRRRTSEMTAAQCRTHMAASDQFWPLMWFAAILRRTHLQLMRTPGSHRHADEHAQRHTHRHTQTCRHAQLQSLIHSHTYTYAQTGTRTENNDHANTVQAQRARHTDRTDFSSHVTRSSGVVLYDLATRNCSQGRAQWLG